MTASPPATDTPPVIGGPRRVLRVGAILAAVVAGLIALVGLLGAALDTAPGHGLIVMAVGRIPLGRGIALRLTRIDGSIYGRMTLRDVAVSDPHGAFLTAPEITLDWRPLALLRREARIEIAEAPVVDLARAPAPRPGPHGRGPSGLPRFHLVLGRLSVGRLVLEPAVTGDRRVATVDASAELLRGQARAWTRAVALPLPGQAAGDRLEARMIAQPDTDRLDLAASLEAPDGGVTDRLLHIKGALRFRLDGAGGWRVWNGQAEASLAGQALLAARLSARSGAFHLIGQAAPALVMGADPMAPLVRSGVDFDLAARLQAKRLAVDAKLRSSALQAAAEGGLDLDHGRYLGLKIQARLVGPGVLPAGWSARDVAGAVVLQGPWAGPDATFDLTAGEIGEGDIRLEALRADGAVKAVGRGAISVSLRAMAGAIDGLPEYAKSLASHPSLDATLDWRGGHLAGGQATFKSGQASAVLTLDPKARSPAGTLKAQVAGYALAGVGTADIGLDARLTSDAAGHLAMDGLAHVQTLRLDSPDLRAILGGDARLNGRLALSADRTLRLSSLNLAAPRLRITEGQGALGPDGRVALDLRGASQDHGPLALQVSGNLSAPHIRLAAANPGLLSLHGLDITADRTPAEGWRLSAHAQAPQGPVAVDARLTAPSGRVSLDIEKATFVGVTASGILRQSETGPLVGDLKLSGDGLAGTARLAPAGHDQSLHLTLKAREAHLPFRPPVTLTRGEAYLDLVLVPGGPRITGAMTLAGLKRGALPLAHAKVDVALAKGVGVVHLTAAGSQEAPFTITAAADIAPRVIRLTASGLADKIPLALASPAVIHLANGGYSLDPVTITLPHGRLSLAGAKESSGARADLRLDDVDLSIAKVFGPEFALGGTATGVAHLDLPAVRTPPTGRVDLRVTGFTRAASAAVSPPVDLSVLGVLSGDDLQAHALMRRGGAIIGRVQMRLTPAAADRHGPWATRLESAQFSGGLRYDGPADVLWGLGGVGGPTLSGPVALGLDVAGRGDAPQLTGVIRGQGLRFADPASGAVIDHMDVAGAFKGSRLDLTQLTARAGQGTLEASGFADVSQAGGFPLDLKIKLAKARLASNPSGGATVSGTLEMTHDRAKGARVVGVLTLDQANYAVGGATAEDVVELSGVRWLDAPMPRAGNVPDTDDIIAQTERPSAWKLDVSVKGGSHVFVKGMGLEAELRTNLHVGGDAKDPVVTGEADLVRGTFDFAGRKLTLSRAVVRLGGATPPDPSLDIAADTTVSGVTITVTIGGTAKRPQITFSSSPALPEDQVLARLLFGPSATTISPIQAVQLAASLNALRGDGTDPVGKVEKAIKLDRLSVYAADPTLGRGTAVGAGKYINSRVYVELTTDAKGYAAMQLEVALTKAFRLLSQVGTTLGGTSINLQYTKRY
jgi:translocation and assembly module TamB